MPKRHLNYAFIFIEVAVFASQTGCRSTRNEVPPPPRFAGDGRKVGSKPVGFGSSPKAGYMTDAANQIAPGISAPSGDRTSIASRDGLRDSPTATFTGDSNLNGMSGGLPISNSTGSGGQTLSSGQTTTSVAPRKNGLGGIFSGMGSNTTAKRDEGIERAGYGGGSPPAAPLDPPVSLPPPPLVPPPASIELPGPRADRAQSEHAPESLPQESAIPPVTAEPVTP